MRDRFFREDENELPYLVWEKRDDDSRSQSYEGPDYPNDEAAKDNGKRILDILASLDLPIGREFRLWEKLMSFLDAKDCTGLRVENGFDMCDFIFTRENEYVRTVNQFEYNVKFENTKRVFHDCYTTHYHDGLLNDSRFQAMIGKTGMEFLGCSGGYECKYLFADDDFFMTDEISIRVSLKAGSKRRSYSLDLDRMELSEEYFEYNL